MRLVGRERQWEYLLAGRAVITLENKNTGNRFTYKVKKKEVNPNSNLYFVSLLQGPDNTSDYNYLGTIFFNPKEEKGEFKLTKNSRAGQDALSFKAFHWFFNMLQQQKELPEGVIVYHEGTCGRCGRTLTVPESIEIGLGPYCRGIA